MGLCLHWFGARRDTPNAADIPSDLLCIGHLAGDVRRVETTFCSTNFVSSANPRAYVLNCLPFGYVG